MFVAGLLELILMSEILEMFCSPLFLLVYWLFAHVLKVARCFFWCIDFMRRELSRILGQCFFNGECTIAPEPPDIPSTLIFSFFRLKYTFSRFLKCICSLFNPIRFYKIKSKMLLRLLVWFITDMMAMVIQSSELLQKESSLYQ